MPITDKASAVVPVPNVKILMRDEPQKTLVARRILEGPATRLKGGRVQVLKPAATAQVQDEGVIVIRKLAENLISLFDDLGCVLGKFFEIVISLAGDDVAMLFALNVEADLLEIADLERRIVEDIEIFRA